MFKKKKLFFSILIFLFSAFAFFSQEADYNQLIQKGKEAEEKFQYIHALSYYYDAMTLDLANGADQAYEAFDTLINGIKSGFPKVKGFNNTELGWRRLQEEFDSFWITNCPLSFDFSNLKKGKMGYGKNYITYSISLQSHFNPKYLEIYDAVQKGFDRVNNEGWKNLNLDWPRTANKKASEFIPGYIRKGKEIFSAARYSPEFYSLDFYISDLNGNILLEARHCKNGKSYTFVNPSKSVEKILDSGKIKIIPKALYLSYGDISGFTKNYSYNLPEMSVNISATRFSSPYSHLLHERSSYKSLSFRKNISSYITMIKVEGGTFSMGSSRGYPREKPVHSLQMSPFEISSTEVTQLLYETVMEENPAFYKGENLPVERVSWYDAIYFCNLLSLMTGKNPCYSLNNSKNPYEWNYSPHKGQHMEGKVECDFTANGFRLPTEAEWEYAAVEGTNNSPYRYSGSNTASEAGWVKNNSDGVTHQVAGKMKNALGIYDMTGNVSEWCWDFYSSYYYYESPESNPKGPSSGSYRIIRGGSIWDDNVYCRVADRSNMDPENRLGTIGIRLARNWTEE